MPNADVSRLTVMMLLFVPSLLFSACRDSKGQTATTPPSVETASAASVGMEPTWVVIDRSDPAFTTFQGIGIEELETERARTASKKSTAIVGIAEVRRTIELMAAAAPERHENPKDIIELVEKLVSPSEPQIGVSWNIGVLVTHGDYEHARKTYAQHASKHDVDAGN